MLWLLKNWPNKMFVSKNDGFFIEIFCYSLIELALIL